MTKPRSVDVEPLDSHRFRLGEGGRWDGTDFWQVDLLDGWLWRSTGGTAELHPVLDLDVPLGAMAPTVDGRQIVIAGTGVALVDDAGHLDWIDRPVQGREPQRRVNDAAVARGRMYFGTMDFPGLVGNGDLWRVDPDRTVTHLFGGLGCPNGPAASADGTVLYLADSTVGSIRRYAVAEDGSLDAGTDFVTVDSAMGKPDGMTVDAEGRLWTALWGGSAVARFDPDGTMSDLVSVPVRQPTSVTIFRGLMHVTSAFEGLDGDDRGELDGATLVLPCDVSAPVTASFG